jgi:hypothetical protein
MPRHPKAPKQHAPHDVDTITDSILRKWKAAGSTLCIRFLDGDRSNCNVDNMQWVAFPDAIQHADDWVCDWDADLTEEEIKMVKDPQWRAGLSFAKRQ